MPGVSRRYFLSLTGRTISSLVAMPAAARAEALHVPWPPSVPEPAPAEPDAWTTLPHDDGGEVGVVTVGIGYAGCAMVRTALHAGLGGVEYAAIDRKRMPSSTCCDSLTSIELPAPPPLGLCHHASPEHGRSAAKACAGEIARAIDRAGLVVLVAGMGGGTATGAAPVVAELARDAGALVVSLVTRPHGLEGRRRNERAAAAIDALARICDTTFVVPLAACAEALDRETPYRRVLEFAAGAVSSGLRVLTAIMSPMPSGGSRVSPRNLRAAMGSGIGAIGVGTATGPGRAQAAARAALASPLVRSVPLGRGGSVLVHIVAPGLAIGEVQEVGRVVSDAAGNDTIDVLCDELPSDRDGALTVTLLGLQCNATRNAPCSAEPHPPQA